MRKSPALTALALAFAWAGSFAAPIVTLPADGDTGDLSDAMTYTFENDQHALVLPDAAGGQGAPAPYGQLLLLGGLAALFGIRKGLSRSGDRHDETDPPAY